MNLEKLYLANAGLTVLTDVAALLLPVRVVWNLSTTRSSKLQLGALLIFGFLYEYPPHILPPDSFPRQMLS